MAELKKDNGMRRMVEDREGKGVREEDGHAERRRK